MRGRCEFCHRFTSTEREHACPPPRPWGQVVPTAQVVPEVERLVRSYGSVIGAGRVYAERHGLTPKAGERLLQRIIHGHVRAVREITVDRLSVTL